MKISGALLLTCALVLSCSNKKEKSPGPVEKAPASGAPTMAPEGSSSMKGSSHPMPPSAPGEVKKPSDPPARCLAHLCYVKRITPAVKRQIEGQKNYKQLRIVFNAGIENEDLKTISVLPWVTQLELPDTAVTDLTPLSGLRDLKVLKIRNFTTKKTIDPTPLAGLKLLTLDLHYTRNHITDLAFLKQMTSLKELILWDARVDDLSVLAGLPELKRLTVHLTGVKSLDFVKALTNLEYLYFSKQAVADLSPLGGLTKLRTLNLVLLSGDLKNAQVIKGLNSLSNLVILHTPLKDLSFVAALKKLRVLKIPGTKIRDIGFVRGLSELVILDLSKTPIVNLAPVAGLRKLVQIHLKGTKAKSLAPLRGLGKLTTLTLDKGFSKAETDALRKTHPALKIY